MKKLLTDEQHNYLLSIYKDRFYAETAQMMNDKFGTSFTQSQIRSYCKGHGMPAFDRSGRQKGWPGHKQSESTRLKIKNANMGRSINESPIGSSFVDQGGYRVIKFRKKHEIGANSRTHWEFEHRLVWEAANGPIPDGNVIIHLNGQKLDNRLENLKCVSKSVASSYRSGHYSDDPDLQGVKLALAELKVAQRNLKKKKSD